MEREGRTSFHAGDGADVPARQVRIEGGGSAKRCATEETLRASQREARWRDALLCIEVTELTSQLERSELKDEADSNTAREERVRQSQSVFTSKGKRVTAPPSMLVTLLTSHRERSRLKSEHW